MITVAMMAVVLLLPLASIGFFRIFENHLIKSTEAELISQSAAIAATMALEWEAPAQGETVRKEFPTHNSDTETNRWNPILPKLNLATDSILGQRGPAQPTDLQITPAYANLTDRLNSVLSRVQQSTLPDFVFWTPTEQFLRAGMKLVCPWLICRRFNRPYPAIMTAL